MRTPTPESGGSKQVASNASVATATQIGRGLRPRLMYRSLLRQCTLRDDAIAARPPRQGSGKSTRTTVKLGRRAVLATLTIGAMIALAAPAYSYADADVDTSFADQ